MVDGNLLISFLRMAKDTLKHVLLLRFNTRLGTFLNWRGFSTGLWWKGRKKNMMFE